MGAIAIGCLFSVSYDEGWLWRFFENLDFLRRLNEYVKVPLFGTMTVESPELVLNHQSLCIIVAGVFSECGPIGYPGLHILSFSTVEHFGYPSLASHHSSKNGNPRWGAVLLAQSRT